MQFEQKHVFWSREVRKRRLFIIWFGCVGLSVVAILSLLRSSPGPSKLVSVNCVSTPSSTNNEATFYITNHTTKPVMAALYIIEVQDGSNWVRWGSWSSQKKLAPRTAEFETVIFARGSLLTNTWRLRGEAREISRGGATILAKAKLLPQLLWMYYGKGQT